MNVRVRVCMCVCVCFSFRSGAYAYLYPIVSKGRAVSVVSAIASSQSSNLMLVLSSRYFRVICPLSIAPQHLPRTLSDSRSFLCWLPRHDRREIFDTPTCVFMTEITPEISLCWRKNYYKSDNWQIVTTSLMLSNGNKSDEFNPLPPWYVVFLVKKEMGERKRKVLGCQINSFVFFFLIILNPIIHEQF